MTPERWRRVEDLFDAAAAVPEPELHAWLERECAGDTELLQEVTAMLAAGAPTRSIQDRIRGVASQMLRAAEAAATRAIEANSADAAAASSLMLALSHLADVKFETGDTPAAQALAARAVKLAHAIRVSDSSNGRAAAYEGIALLEYAKLLSSTHERLAPLGKREPCWNNPWPNTPAMVNSASILLRLAPCARLH